MTEREDKVVQTRRGWLVGVAAMLAGAGAALWRWQETPVKTQALAELWDAQVLTPDGQPLSLVSLLESPCL